MTKKNELTPKQAKVRLNTLIPDYAYHKDQENVNKTQAAKENKQIKELLEILETNTYEAGGYEVTVTEAVSKSFNEAALIDIIKQSKIRGVIKRKEYVDMDALESAIYNGKIDAATLAPSQTEKRTSTLRYKEAKKEAE